MHEHRFDLVTVVETLAGGARLGEALGFPEVSRLGKEAADVRAALIENAARLLDDGPLALAGRRHAPPGCEVRALEVVIDPPERSAAWPSPVRLPLEAVVVRQGALGPAVGFLPALGVAAIARSPDGIDDALREEARFALARAGSLTSLGQLAALARDAPLELGREEIAIPLRGSAERDPSLRAGAEGGADATHVLDEVCEDLGALADRGALAPAWQLEPLVAELAAALAPPSAGARRRPVAVLLTGPQGTGKSAAIEELARSRARHGLAGRRLLRTSGARLVAGATGFGAWQERCRALVREAAREGALIHLGSLAELDEVGRGEHCAQSVAHFLRPYLARGELAATAEATVLELERLERDARELVQAFRRLDVPEPAPAVARRILDDEARLLEGRRPPSIGADAIAEVERLHRRFAGYSAFPGRPLRFLRDLHRDAAARAVLAPPPAPAIGAAEVNAAFARETGLGRFLLDDRAPLDLAAAERFFEGHVIGQRRAVRRVLDALAAVKAGLHRPRRPVASLLFAGPTGVGKTELARTLARFLFGDADRLVRFDMSEVQDPLAVERLIAAPPGGGGAGAAGGEGLLTAKVRAQPFAVVLFDEVEKAHPLFFDLCLQILGEGRLTDRRGRLADFSNAVVVLTSNLGAESYRPDGFGFAGGGADAEAHFVEAVRAFFRPELFARIDHVLGFEPLDAASVRAIAARELEAIRARDGLRRRGVEVALEPGVIDEVARAGYDARYGARPLKRALERLVLAPLADGLNRYEQDVPLVARVRCAAPGVGLGAPGGGASGDAAASGDEGIVVEVSRRPPAARSEAAAAESRGADAGATPDALVFAELAEREASPAGRPVPAVVGRASAARRLLVRLGDGAAFVALENQGAELRAALGRARPARGGHDEAGEDGRGAEVEAGGAPRGGVGAAGEAAHQAAARLAGVDQLLARHARLAGEAAALEERLLILCYEAWGAHRPIAAEALSAPAGEVERLAASVSRLLLDALRLGEAHPDRAVIGCFAEDRDASVRMASAYQAAAQAVGLDALAFQVVSRTARDPETGALATKLAAVVVDDPARPFSPTGERPVAVGVDIAGPGAWVRFDGERGVHRLRARGRSDEQGVFVDPSAGTLERYSPSLEMLRRKHLEGQQRVRLYDARQGVVADGEVGQMAWDGRRLDEALQQVLARRLVSRLHALCSA